MVITASWHNWWCFDIACFQSIVEYRGDTKYSPVKFSSPDSISAKNSFVPDNENSRQLCELLLYFVLSSKGLVISHVQALFVNIAEYLEPQFPKLFLSWWNYRVISLLFLFLYLNGLAIHRNESVYASLKRYNYLCVLKARKTSQLNIHATNIVVVLLKKHKTVFLYWIHKAWPSQLCNSYK